MYVEAPEGCGRRTRHDVGRQYIARVTPANEARAIRNDSAIRPRARFKMPLAATVRRERNWRRTDLMAGGSGRLLAAGSGLLTAAPRAGKGVGAGGGLWRIPGWCRAYRFGVICMPARSTPRINRLPLLNKRPHPLPHIIRLRTHQLIPVLNRHRRLQARRVNSDIQPLLGQPQPHR